MRNYMHVLVMMLRFRQMCCHRELIKEVRWAEVMKEDLHLLNQLFNQLRRCLSRSVKKGNASIIFLRPISDGILRR